MRHEREFEALSRRTAWSFILVGRASPSTKEEKMKTQGLITLMTVDALMNWDRGCTLVEIVAGYTRGNSFTGDHHLRLKSRPLAGLKNDFLLILIAFLQYRFIIQ